MAKVKVLMLVPPERIAKYGAPGQHPEDWELVYGLDMTDEQRLAAAGDADYLYTGSVVEVSTRLIEGMTKLRMIQAEGVGFERIDLAAAARRGIPVCNCAGTNAGAVAEQTVMLILAVQRFLVEGHHAVFQGRFMQCKNRVMQEDMVELADCHVGLVGLGNIAVETARRLRAFGCRISYWNRSPKPELERELGIDYLELDELLKGCDVISLHTAVAPETRHIICERTLGLMKPGAVLVITARGRPGGRGGPGPGAGERPAGGRGSGCDGGGAAAAGQPAAAPVSRGGPPPGAGPPPGRGHRRLLPPSGGHVLGQPVPVRGGGAALVYRQRRGDLMLIEKNGDGPVPSPFFHSHSSGRAVEQSSW